MPINIGNINNIDTDIVGSVFVGEEPIGQIYVGSELVWQGNEDPSSVTITFASGSTSVTSGNGVVFRANIVDDNLSDGVLELLENGSSIQSINTTAGTTQYLSNSISFSSQTSKSYQWRYTDAGGKSITSSSVSVQWTNPSLKDSLSDYETIGIPDTFTDSAGCTGGNQSGHSGNINFTNDSGQTISVSYSASGPYESLTIPSNYTILPGGSPVFNGALSYGLTWDSLVGTGRQSFSIKVSFSAPGYSGFSETLLSGTACQPGS